MVTVKLKHSVLITQYIDYFRLASPTWLFYWVENCLLPGSHGYLIAMHDTFIFKFGFTMAEF